MKASLVLFCFLIVLVAGSDTKPKCDPGCPDNLDYVCAKNADGKETKFENDCMLKLAQCQHPDEGYKLHKRGPC